MDRKSLATMSNVLKGLCLTGLTFTLGHVRLFSQRVSNAFSSMRLQVWECDGLDLRNFCVGRLRHRPNLENSCSHETGAIISSCAVGRLGDV